MGHPALVGGNLLGGAVAGAGVLLAAFLEDVGGSLPQFGAAGLVVSVAIWAMRINNNASKDAALIRAEANEEAIERYREMIEDLQTRLDSSQETNRKLRARLDE
jgi:hypothetical protein